METMPDTLHTKYSRMRIYHWESLGMRLGYNSMGMRLDGTTIFGGKTVWEQDWWVQQYGNCSLVPRPFLPPVFDCLQYAKNRGGRA